MLQKWDSRFITLAACIATWSKDPEEQVGCVIVSPDRHQFVLGYNGFPKGVYDSKSRLEDRSLKLNLTVHAELNAILNARYSVFGWTLYATKAPCIDCAKAVIQAGIKQIVMLRPMISSNWYGDQTFARAMMKEAGLTETCFDGDEIQ